MLKHLIKVNKCGNLFLTNDFELVGASLSLLPKNGNRDRKRYKKIANAKRYIEKIGI